MSENAYTLRRSKLSLFIGYFLAEAALIAILALMLVIWRDEPTYLDWPIAITSWIAVALFFHFLLFIGNFYAVHIKGKTIEYHAFLRKTKRFYFSDIKKAEPSTGLDVKIVGHNGKILFYVKVSDRNFDRFMVDLNHFADME